MRSRLSALSLIFLASTSLHVAAAPATQEQADKIAAGVKAYLTDTPGVVSVMPNGDDYEIKIDLVPLFKKYDKSGTQITFTPMVMHALDQGGGKWTVTQDQSAELNVKQDKTIDLSMKIGNIKGSSTFDEAAGIFTAFSSDFTDLSLDESVMSTENQGATVSYTLKSAHYEGTNAMSGEGSVDGKLLMTLHGLSEKLGMPMQGGGQPVPITISAESGTQDFIYSGVKFAAVKELFSWMTANADTSDTAKLEEVRKLLKAALPVIAAATSTAKMQNMTVDTPMGQFGIASANVNVNFKGFVEAGEFGEGISIEGLKLPQGLVPTFAVDLVPHDFAFDFKVSDFNAAAAAKVFVDEFDFKQSKQSPEFDAKLLEALLPTGSVTISTSSTSAKAVAYDTSIGGSMSVGSKTKPSGQATIKLKGIDQIVKLLQAAPPDVQQYSAVLLMAKGFGKSEADETLWEVSATSDGKVLVNGVDLSKMVPTPPPQP